LTLKLPKYQIPISKLLMFRVNPLDIVEVQLCFIIETFQTA
jgi:hypothetical protein